MVGSSEGPRRLRRRGERRKTAPGNFLRKPESWLLFLSLAALVVIFSSGVLPVPSPIRFIASLVLFMTPGTVLASLLLQGSERDLDLPAVVPIAFALSAGVFGVFAIPLLILEWSFRAYLLVCGAGFALSLLGAFFLILRSQSVGTEPDERQEERGSWLLWIPLAILTVILAVTSVNVTTLSSGDAWLYMMYVRDYMSGGQLSSRTDLGGWLLEQAALSKISGIDPVPLLAHNLGPALVVLSMLAFYGLARILFRDSRAALLASSLAALFFLTHMTSLEDSGAELVVRITEDKYVARFVILPVALSLAVLFVRRHKLSYLGAFTFICWSVVSIHYIGFALIGASLAGFGLISVLLHPRDRSTWLSFGALGGVMLAAVLAAFAYGLVRGSSAIPQLGSMSPESKAIQIYVSEKIKHHLLVLGKDSYIMHPSLVLDPFIFVALLLGVPFLIYRVRQSLAARMLLGTLLFTAILVYVPPVSTFIAGIIGPWMLWRVAWPIELAALLTFGWVVWSTIAFATGYLERVFRGRSLVPVLSLLLVGVLSAVLFTPMANGVRASSDTGEKSQDDTTCEDPVFPWMSGVVKRQTVVFSQDKEQHCVIAYVASAKVFSLRSRTYEVGQTLLEEGSNKQQELPQAIADQKDFFDARVLDEEAIHVLNRNDVGYVLLSSNSPLNDQLQHLPGFKALDDPGNRYSFFEVNPRNIERTPAVTMNDRLAARDWKGALEIYPQVLQGDKNEQFLAHVGAGIAYKELDEPDRAAESYKQALSLFPESPTVYPLLAEAYRGTGNREAARNTLEKAVARYPKNVDLRFELASMLMSSGAKDKALEQYQAVVKIFPEVPVYRTRFGAALLEANMPEMAGNEFEHAIHLNPFLTSTYLKIGQANETAGRRGVAIETYERAIRMDLDSQVIRLKLGQAYAALATPGKKENFGRAEENLKMAAEMNSVDPSKNRSDQAYVALGNLYRRWKRPEDAKTAYEKALKTNPDFKPASNKLKKLQQRNK